MRSFGPAKSRSLNPTVRSTTLNHTTLIRIFSTRVKPSFSVLPFTSIGKQTSTMTSPFRRAGNKIGNLIKLYSTLTNNSLCGMKGKSQSIEARFGRLNVAFSQGLEDTGLRFGILGYDYKSGICMIHSRKCGKLSGSKVPDKKYNTAFQDISEKNSLFSNGGFQKLWELKNNKGKHSKLIDIISDPTTLVAAYESIKFASMTSAVYDDTFSRIDKA